MQRDESHHYCLQHHVSNHHRCQRQYLVLQHRTASGTITITASGQTVTYGTAPNTSAVLNTTYSLLLFAVLRQRPDHRRPDLTISGSNGTSTSGNYNIGSWTITPPP